jgi:hypothetical protein
MSNWICKYCGKDTSDVDYDYLDGFNHLGCTLEALTPKKKVMKIKGWEKISGYTYKGMSIVNPIHNANETKYTADVINLSLPQKPKWELNVLTPAFKFKGPDDDTFSIMLWDENKLHTTQLMTAKTIKSISNFRQTFEELVDKMLSLQLTSAPQFSSHSFNVNGTQRMRINSNGHATIGNGVGGNGILNVVNNSGTIIDYSKVIAEMAKAISSDKSLSNQFKDIINEINKI